MHECVCFKSQHIIAYHCFHRAWLGCAGIFSTTLVNPTKPSGCWGAAVAHINSMQSRLHLSPNRLHRDRLVLAPVLRAVALVITLTLIPDRIDHTEG